MATEDHTLALSCLMLHDLDRDIARQRATLFAWVMFARYEDYM